MSDDAIDNDTVIEETPANTQNSGDDDGADDDDDDDDGANDGDDVILNAIRTIVRATNTPYAAKATIQLLQERLKKSLNSDISISDDDADGNDEDGNNSDLQYPNDGDGNRGNDDGSDIEEILKAGAQKVSSTKKTENEKWKELLVYI